MGKKSIRQKRGYPVGLIIVFESMKASFWKIFSERAVSYKDIKLGRKFENANKTHLYHYFEEIVNELRPLIKEGIKSILLANPPKFSYGSTFLSHIKSHQKWMIQEKNVNSVCFNEVEGNFANMDKMAIFLQSEEYSAIMGETNENEADKIISILEKRLNDTENGLFLCVLKEIEKLVYAGGKRKKKFKPLKLIPEYILLTNKYLDSHPQKNRVQTLIQIAKNRNIIVKIIDSENSAGMRISQLGGISCFLQMNSEYEKKISENLIN